MDTFITPRYLMCRKESGIDVSKDALAMQRLREVSCTAIV